MMRRWSVETGSERRRTPPRNETHPRNRQKPANRGVFARIPSHPAPYGPYDAPQKRQKAPPLPKQERGELIGGRNR
jgi:hypothetical protein